jgi:hypothetical protein
VVKFEDNSFNHIVRMTDDIGILEHCIFATPDRLEGYCTDDNARALQLSLRTKKKMPITTYLRFIISARTPKGFHQDLNSDLTWKDDDEVNEGFGRAMAALGEASIKAPADDQKLAAAFVFDKQAILIKDVKDPRAIAQVITGIFHRMKFEAANSQLVPHLILRKKLKGDMPIELSINLEKELLILADKLTNFYLTNSSSSWKWYEELISYDNGRLPLAMFYVYQATKNKKYLDVAKDSLDFLIDKTYDNSKDCFSFPGYRGWYPKNGKKALFGQQPIEAGSTTEACSLAYKITKEPKYLDFAKKAFSWYSGKNILGISLIDKTTCGIYDGLEPWGLNPNQGAESSISYLLARLSFES